MKFDDEFMSDILQGWCCWDIKTPSPSVYLTIISTNSINSTINSTINSNTVYILSFSLPKTTFKMQLISISAAIAATLSMVQFCPAPPAVLGPIIAGAL